MFGALAPRRQPMHNTQGPVTSSEGQIREAEHGLHITAIEAGAGTITRQRDGGPTRFTFKKPFKHLPHVQLTADLGTDPNNKFENEWIYLLGNNAPAVDKEGFSVGVYTRDGRSINFQYLAIGISESAAPKQSSQPTKPTAKKHTKKSPMRKAGDEGEEEGEDEEGEDEQQE